MTATPPKFIAKPLERSIIEKIELSVSQCEDEEFREIRCPYCSTPIATVTVNMKEGFIAAKCQKYKAITPLNLAYFYTSNVIYQTTCIPSECNNKNLILNTL